MIREINVGCAVCIIRRFFGVLLSVAYFVLVERKLLGYIQNRKGPNKVGLVGIGQPWADAIKLLNKEIVVPRQSNRFLFFLGPIIIIGVGLSLWVISPGGWFSSSFHLWSALIFLRISGTRIYGVLIRGWASNRKYALFGAVRGMAQVISYEVVILVTVLIPRFRLGTYDYFFLYSQKAFALGILWAPIFYVWVLGVLAETHRAPFDFVEGESELVSGYNVEYSGGLFVLLFLGEYCGIIYIRMLTVLLWWKYLVRFSIFFFSRALVVLLLILIRGRFPRLRYDLLIMLIWKTLLPVTLRFLIFFLLSYRLLQKIILFDFFIFKEC